MNTNYTAIVKEDAGWWIGWVEEVPGVNCQEQSREELLIGRIFNAIDFTQKNELKGFHPM